MFKFPKLTVFAFVICAIALGGVIHRYSATFGSANFASEEDPIVDQIKRLVERTSKVNLARELTALGAQGALDAHSCQCTLAGIETPLFQFEDPKRCSAERLYLENDLNKLPPIFRDGRASSPGEFPRVCMTYILRKNFENSENSKTTALATCKTADGQPVHGNYPACVTEKYVNAVYNYFADVTDCMGIPQRDFMPKLSVESGLHINSINAKGDYDGGLAQLTHAAISHGNDPKTGFPVIKRRMLASNKESCKRLEPYIKNFSYPKSGKENRCQLISVPANPLASMIVMSTKIIQDRDSIAKYMAATETGGMGLNKNREMKYNIIARMEKLGLAPKDYDYEQLMQMMIVLGYNAGAKTAVAGLSNYLSMIEASGRKLTKADFDIGGESQIYVALNSETRTLERKPANTDAIWAKRLATFETRRALLPSLRTTYKPEIERVSLRGPDGKSYSTYRVDYKVSELSYAAYSQLYQGSGSGGYLNNVYNAGNNLNSVFKAGTCVPESFLSL